MSLARENKTLNAKHAQILRELVKRPDNKICADCKKNDARWASVNLGVFMCIRCSGIHRSLGVHITRIKSIDLDTWAPEQVSNVQRWGNKRANKYWEAHLKQGHIPPDHKMDSFIRSKYESKRWAMEGPVPDPETLDDGEEGSSTTPTEPSAPPPKSSRAAAISDEIDFLSGPVAPPAAAPVTRSVNVTAQSHASSAPGRSATPRSSSTTSPPPPSSSSAAEPNNGGGLFDLDFAQPASSSSPAPSRPSSSKADILSLFSKPAPARPAAATANSFGASVGQQPQSTATHAVTDAFEGLSFGATSNGPPQYQTPYQPPTQRQPSASYAPQAANPWAAPPPSAQAQGQPSQAPPYHQRADSFGQMNSAPTSAASSAKPAASTSHANNFSGLFDSADVWGSAPPAAAPHAAPTNQSTSSTFGFGDFSSSASSAAPTSTSSSTSSKMPAFDDFGDIWKS